MNAFVHIVGALLCNGLGRTAGWFPGQYSVTDGYEPGGSACSGRQGVREFLLTVVLRWLSNDACHLGGQSTQRPASGRLSHLCVQMCNKEGQGSAWGCVERGMPNSEDYH